MDKRRLLGIPILTFAVMLGAVAEGAAQDRPYRQGTVWDISYVRTEPGQFDAYMDNLRNGWMRTLEAAKAEGHVVSYRVITAQRSNPQDWDLLLLVEYPNMAALDNSVAVLDRISAQVLGQNLQQSSEATVQRRQLREILGGKLGRELIFRQ